MQYYSPISNINGALDASHKAYKTVASEILGIDVVDLDRLIAASFTTIAACSTAGWYIGHIIYGEPGATIGGAIGACIGLVIVVGAISYRMYFNSEFGRITSSTPTPMLDT